MADNKSFDGHALLARVEVESDAAVRSLSGAVSTAATAWGGNGLLVSYLTVLQHSLKGKCSVCLGSGLGIFEILLAYAGSNVLATDVEAVVPSLQGNITRNAALLDGSPYPAGGIRSTALDWTQQALPLDVACTGPFDFIFASDCVYWPSLFQPLVSTLSSLCALPPPPWLGQGGEGEEGAQAHGERQGPHVFLTVECRQATELQFFSLLDSQGFRWYRVDEHAAGHEALARSSSQAVGLFYCARVGTRAVPRAPAAMPAYAGDAPLPADVEAAARLIWAYHSMGHTPATRADLILCLCSNDPRVARHAAQLWLRGVAPLLMFSGGVGKLTEGLYGGLSEGQYFADIAVREMGVPSSAVLVEGRSTNTGENIRFSAQVLRESGLFHTAAEGSGGGESGVYASPARVLLVQKPFMERRSCATFEAQGLGLPCVPGEAGAGRKEGGDWAHTSVVRVSSPPIPWSHYPIPHGMASAGYPSGLDRRRVIEVMCGDLQRIALYPARGFQTQQAIPRPVWSALEVLVQAGYTGHMMVGPGGSGVAGVGQGQDAPPCVLD